MALGGDSYSCEFDRDQCASLQVCALIFYPRGLQLNRGSKTKEKNFSRESS
jgi:hypothetical protein